MEKYEYPGDSKKREVLRLTLKDSFKTHKLAQNIEKHCKRFGQYRLYNVDILKEQSYMYEHDVYPAGIYDIIRCSNKKNDTTLRWIPNNDDIGSFDYIIPSFKILSLKIHSKKESQWKTFDDKIERFRIKINGGNDIQTEEEIEIYKNNEIEILL